MILGLILGNHVGPALLIYKLAIMIMPGSFVLLFLSIATSFFGHFFMDMIPHKDWAFVEGEVNKEKLIMIAFIDVGLAILVLLVLSACFFGISAGGVLCSFAACAPDLNKFIRFPAWINRLHEKAHHSWRKNGNNDGLPTWQLGFLFLILIFALLYKTLIF